MKRPFHFDIIPADYSERHSGRVIDPILDYIEETYNLTLTTLPKVGQFRYLDRFVKTNLQELLCRKDLSIISETWSIRFLGAKNRQLFIVHLEVNLNTGTVRTFPLKCVITRHAIIRFFQHYKPKTLDEFLRILKERANEVHNVSMEKSGGRALTPQGDELRFADNAEQGAVLTTFISEKSRDLRTLSPLAAKSKQRIKIRSRSRGQATDHVPQSAPLPTTPTVKDAPDTRSDLSGQKDSLFLPRNATLLECSPTHVIYLADGRRIVRKR